MKPKKYPHNKLLIQMAEEAPGDEVFIVRKSTSEDWPIDMLFLELEGKRRWYLTHAINNYIPDQNRKLTEFEMQILISSLFIYGITDYREG